MDDEKGRNHPIAGANLAATLVECVHGWWNVFRHPVRSTCDEAFIFAKWREGKDIGYSAKSLALGHSRFFAKKQHREVSELFRADKLCTRFDPLWFYLLRAKASGEVHEYVARSPLGYVAPEYWAAWYFKLVEKKFA